MFWRILCVWRGWPGTRIFSPLAVPRLCVPIGHYWYLFKRLTVLSARRFYRFEHIETYSSGKVVGKVEHWISKSCRTDSSPSRDGSVYLNRRYFAAVVWFCLPSSGLTGVLASSIQSRSTAVLPRSQAFYALEKNSFDLLNRFGMVLRRVAGADEFFRCGTVDMGTGVFHDAIVSFLDRTVTLDRDDRVHHYSIRNRNLRQFPDEPVIRVHSCNTRRNVADLTKHKTLLLQGQ